MKIIILQSNSFLVNFTFENTNLHWFPKWKLVVGLERRKTDFELNSLPKTLFSLKLSAIANLSRKRRGDYLRLEREEFENLKEERVSKEKTWFLNLKENPTSMDKRKPPIPSST